MASPSRPSRTSAGTKSGAIPRPRFRVRATRGGLRPGVDPLKLNRLNDELQDEELVAQMRRDETR